MTLWFRRERGMYSKIMRQIADDADVSWSGESIVYRGRGIGYADGDSDDVDDLQDAAESLLGYRPIEIDEPPEPTDP